MPITTLRGAKAKVAALEMGFSQEEIDALKTQLLELTQATVIVRSPKRDEWGKVQYIEVPDNGLRLAAVVKAIEFGIGKARQFIDVQTSNGNHAPDGQNLAKLLAGNPELVVSILTTLQESLKSSEAIAVQAVTSEAAISLPESESGSPPR